VLDGTYTGLKESIASWMHRTDLTDLIPDFVALAEERIANELRLRLQISEATLTTVAGTQDVTLPTDWLEIENLSLNTPVKQLTYVNIEHLDSKYPSDFTGEPAVYTIEGNEIYFGPCPDAVYSVGLWYYARFPALATAGTNTLLTKYPSIYLYGALAEAANWAQDDILMTKCEIKYKAAVKQAQTQDDEAVHSGSALRVRRI